MTSRMGFLWSLLGLSLFAAVVATSSAGPAEVVSAAAAGEASESVKAPVFTPAESDSEQIIVSSANGVACSYPGGNCPPPTSVCSFAAVEQYSYVDQTNDIAAVLVFTASDGCTIGATGSIRVTGAAGELGRSDGRSTIDIRVSLPRSPDKRSYTVEALNSSDDLYGSRLFSLGPPAGTCPMQPPPPAGCTFTGVGDFSYSGLNNNIDALLTFTVSGCTNDALEAFDGTPDNRGNNVNFKNGVTTVSLMATLPCSPSALPYTVEAFDANGLSLGSRTFQLGPPPGTCPMP